MLRRGFTGIDIQTVGFIIWHFPAYIIDYANWGPPHFRNAVLGHLTATFGARWKGRVRPTAWPERSPVLTCLDLFLWGYMKSMVYETDIDSEEDLVACIVSAAAEIRETSGIFGRVLEWVFFFFFLFFFRMKYVLFLLFCKVFGLTQNDFLHITTTFHPFFYDLLALKRSVTAHRFLNEICFNEGYLSGPKVRRSNLETICVYIIFGAWS